MNRKDVVPWLIRLGLPCAICLFILIFISFIILNYLPNGQYCPLAAHETFETQSQQDETYDDPEKTKERYLEIAGLVKADLLGDYFSIDENASIYFDYDQGCK